MKFSALTYAKAFMRAAEERPNEEVGLRKRFLALIARNGDTAGFPKVLRELTRLKDAEGNIRRVEVESARPLSSAKLQELRTAFGKGYAIETSITPELIAGIRVTIDGESVIDASIRGKVKKLFK